jgi:hypothetical protein
MTSPRDRRVTLALKWHYLDNLGVGEIQERFDQEGIGSYARSTIRGYLNEDPEEAVIEQIEAEQSNVRLQIAEREERMFQRARDAETQATRDEPIKRAVPQTSRVSTGRETAISVPNWEVLDEDDPERPDWATSRDVVIRFSGGTRRMRPGEEYPIQAVDGSPTYTTEMVGLERDQLDLQGQALARKEQSAHLEAKGEALGIYKDRLELTGEGGGPMEVIIGGDDE